MRPLSPAERKKRERRRRRRRRETETERVAGAAEPPEANPRWGIQEPPALAGARPRFGRVGSHLPFLSR